MSQDGGYAEYVTLRTEAVLPISKDLDPAEAAPLLCAGITTFNALRHVPDLKKGDLVAVLGLGGKLFVKSYASPKSADFILVQV